MALLGGEVEGSGENGVGGGGVIVVVVVIQIDFRQVNQDAGDVFGAGGVAAGVVVDFDSREGWCWCGVVVPCLIVLPTPLSRLARPLADVLCCFVDGVEQGSDGTALCG